MRFFAKKYVKEPPQKLPKDHKCYGCVWVNYHDSKVVCMRMPCVREKPGKE